MPSQPGKIPKKQQMKHIGLLQMSICLDVYSILKKINLQTPFHMSAINELGQGGSEKGQGLAWFWIMIISVLWWQGRHHHMKTSPNRKTVLVLKKQHQFSTMDSIHECSCKAGRTTAWQKHIVQSGVPHKLFNHQQKISRGNLAQKGRGGMEWVPATPSAPPPANFFAPFCK